MKKTETILVLVLTFFMTGCQSIKPVNEKGAPSLVVLIIDENNQAVEDYSIVLKGVIRSGSFRTNAQGMCSFTGVKKKSYRLNGQKNGYTSLVNIPLELDKNDNVLCFSVTSEKSVFENALMLYNQNLFIDGLDLLNTLYVKPDSWSAVALGLYKTVGLLKTNQKEEAQNQITQARKILYTVDGKISEENNQFFFEGEFINHTELEVSAFTVVFSICDSDGEAVAGRTNNIVHKIEKKVLPFSQCDFSIPLNEYFIDDQITQAVTGKQKALNQEYLYVSQILYTDESMWLDPFGLEFLK